MSGWSGWVGDLIDALGVPNTADNRSFLADWAAHQPSRCMNNPLLASWKATGSTNCRITTGGAWAQSYPTHAAAINATVRQLRDPIFAGILFGLEWGHPLTSSSLDKAITELRLWGANNYADAVSAEAGVGGKGGSGNAPAHVTVAWTRWMRKLAHDGPRAHNRIRKATHRARRLARKR